MNSENEKTFDRFPILKLNQFLIFDNTYKEIVLESKKIYGPISLPKISQRRLSFAVLGNDRQSLWFCDYASHSIHKYKVKGKRELSTWTGQETQLRYPTRIIFDDHDNAYAIDAFRIVKIDKDGLVSLWSHYGTLMTDTFATRTIRHSNGVFGFCTKHQCIYMMTWQSVLCKITQNEVTPLFTSQESVCEAMAVSRSGDLYLASSKDIYRLDPDTWKMKALLNRCSKNRAGYPFAPKGIRDLFLTKTGVLYILDEATIYRYRRPLTRSGLIRLDTFPWNIQRLLWIALFKNDPTDCPLASLPRDIIRNLKDYFVL